MGKFSGSRSNAAHSQQTQLFVANMARDAVLHPD
jgi:hypothetical protein